MRLIGMMVIGLGGLAILLALGVWQLQRLNWKQALLADINREISGPVEMIPEIPLASDHTFLPVSAEGSYFGPTVRVLVSQKLYGAGYRLLTGFETSTGRKVIIDRGFVSVNAAQPGEPKGTGSITGNLHWPLEVDGFTPENDIAANIWFSRDVDKLAAHLGTEPTLVILRRQTLDDTGITPLPVDTVSIPNDHLNYAVTWFSLALIWLGMSLYFLYRLKRPSNDGLAQ